MWAEEGFEPGPEGLAASAREFEENIYPTVRHYFGSEWSPGVDNDVHIHLLNARLDENTLGYYSSADEYPYLVNPFSNQREMVYLNLLHLRPGSRSYNSVLAHEFQHMVHWNQDRNESTWVNEGLAQMAAKLAGYGATGGAPLSLFTAQPDIQLNDWAEDPSLVGSHYAASFLFMEYLRERLGEDFLRELVAAPSPGEKGLAEALAGRPGAPSFEGIFLDWLIANYLDRPDIGEGRYGYRELEVKVKPSERLKQYPAEGSATVRQYAADYIELGPAGTPIAIEFSGGAWVKFVDTEPRSGRYLWWSNRGDASDMALTRAFDLSGLRQATLSFWLWYDIERDFDYAYVEVSTDGGRTWQTLEGRHTTSTNPNGNNFGHGYTGRSGSGKEPAWVEERIDLTPFAGQKILVRFEYITDDAYNGSGLCLDDLAVPELGYMDGAEEGAAGWEAAGFLRSDNLIPQRFNVRLIEFGPEIAVREMPLDGENRGRQVIKSFGEEVERAVLVVAALAPATTEPAAYSYRIFPPGN